MCDPASALMAASSVASFAGQQSATDSYNAQAAAAQRDAQIATANKYTDVQRKYQYDAKSLNQQGYTAAMKGRAEVASGIASAGASGIAGGSLTLDNLIAASRQTAAENEARIQNKRDDATDALIGNFKSIEAEGKQRINSTPFKEGPNPLGLAIGLATSGLNAGINAGAISKEAFGGFNIPRLFGTT